MAEKKESLTALKMQLGKLQKKEQTPEVMEQIDDLKLRIETMEAESKNSKKEDPKPASKTGFKTFEKWMLSPKGDKIKMLKEVRILQEHADMMNAQTVNTQIEYIEKEG